MRRRGGSDMRDGKYIYADALHSELREGDLVIFKGKQVHDAVIRWCTSSEYNHVGLVVEVAGELELFEATQLGVGRTPLEFYMNSYYWAHMSGLFHKVVIRPLYIGEQRGLSHAQRAELARYQDEMLGRKFCMNPIAYMNALLNLPQAEDMSTAFCSQLVAGAYKRLGLLPEQPAASSYLPRDFAASASGQQQEPQRKSQSSGRKALPLSSGARLGRERQLRFEESPLLPPATRRSSLRASLFGGGGRRSQLSRASTARQLQRSSTQTAAAAEASTNSSPAAAVSWTQRATRRVSSLLPGAAPHQTAEAAAAEAAKARQAAETALTTALALYRVRAWLRRAVRRRRLAEQLLADQHWAHLTADQQQQQQQQQQADAPAATLQAAEILVEVRRD